MYQNKINAKKRILSIFIIIINFLTFVFGWIFFSKEGSFIKLLFITYVLLFIIYLIVFIFFSTLFDGFAFDRRKISENAYSLSLSSLVSILIFYFLNTLAFRTFYSFIYLFFVFFVIVIENIIFARLSNRIIFKNYVQKRTVIYYKKSYDLDNIKKLTYFDIKYKVIKKIRNPAKLDKIINCDVVFISGIKPSVRDSLIKKCLIDNIELFIFPSVEDVIVSGGKYVEELALPMLRIDEASNILYSIFKRTFDIIVALIALIILSPFMLITSIVIRLYDGGPALYTQDRLTKDGKVFTIYKFRSMRVDAEKDGIARVSSKNDNRITPIGRFIRKIRFDELPQLFNILSGDMSIVGPRPERPEIAKQYEKKHPSFALRLQVKAGLTGYAQVYGKYNTDPLDKLKMDLFYINKKSFLYDFRICFMTLKILFMKESTEAIDEGHTIAGK